MDFKKLRTRRLTPAEIAPGESGPVTVIIKSRHENYCPPTAVLRTRLDPYLATCEIDAAELENLRRDPKVVSVELARPVGPAADRE